MRSHSPRLARSLGGPHAHPDHRPWRPAAQADVLWIETGASGSRDAFAPFSAPDDYPSLRWHALAPDSRTLDSFAVAQLAMRCHWWLAGWARARGGRPSAAHFAGRAAPLAHYAVLAKRSGSHYARTLISVQLAPPPAPVGPIGAAGLPGQLARGTPLAAAAEQPPGSRAPALALEALAEACMCAHARRHADACVAPTPSLLRAAASARACAGAYELQPILGAGLAMPADTAERWAARSRPRALDSALQRADEHAARERSLAWARHGPAGDARPAAGGAGGGAVAPGAASSAPVLSVCIVSHDRGALLRQAVESVRAQLGVPSVAALLRSTLVGAGRGPAPGAASDVELLVVDDASTDAATVRYLAELDAHAAAGSGGAAAARAGAHGRVAWPLRVHRLAANGYLGAARNAAARLSRGAWLLYVDDDNVAKPHMLVAFATAAARSGADVLTCANHKWPSAEAPPQPEAAALVDAASGALLEPAPDDWAASAAAGSAERGAGAHWLPLGPCAELGAHANCFGDAHVLIRRAALERVGGYTSDYGLGLEDWELYARLAMRAARDAAEARAAGGEALPPVQHLVIPSPLYWYRLSRGGGMLARQHADGAEAGAQRLADRLRSLRPYVERSWGDDGGAASPTPSLEALLLYSEALRPLDARAPGAGCGADAGAPAWLRGAALPGAALALAWLGLRRARRAYGRGARAHRSVDRSA